MKQGRRQKTRTSDLYDIAEKSGTEIICSDLPETCSVSVRTGGGGCYIGIDPFGIETTAQERVHLAHELGHCETGAFYNAYSNLDIRERQEARANRWAVAKLVPAPELERAIKSAGVEIWELAEIFDVTDDFMRTALEYYRTSGRIDGLNI